MLAAAAVACAAAQAPQSGSCHADVLLGNIREKDLTNEEVQSMCQVASQKIAAEVGSAPADVSTHVFPGDYNAPWSPSVNRPQADLFLASIIRNCRSASVVMGIFRGPQLAEDLLAELNSVLGSSPALTGALTVSGTAVVPAESVPGGVAPELPAMAPRPASQAATTSSPSFGWIFVVLALLVALAAAVPMVMKRLKEGREEESDDERAAFTGH